MNTPTLWAMFFAQIVAIKEHPKNEAGADLFECARMADEMMDHYLDRFEKRKFIRGNPCQSDQPPSGQ